MTSPHVYRAWQHLQYYLVVQQHASNPMVQVVVANGQFKGLELTH